MDGANHSTINSTLSLFVIRNIEDDHLTHLVQLVFCDGIVLIGRGQYSRFAILLRITPERSNMKLIFNDATELVIQSADIRLDGSLLIKTISATEEDLRTMFSDTFKLQKLTVKERESTLAKYENYTELNALVKYTAGILGVALYKKGATAQERLATLEAENEELKEKAEALAAENAELSATMDTVLTEIIPSIMGTETE